MGWAQSKTSKMCAGCHDNRKAALMQHIEPKPKLKFTTNNNLIDYTLIPKSFQSHQINCTFQICSLELIGL